MKSPQVEYVQVVRIPLYSRIIIGSDLALYQGISEYKELYSPQGHKSVSNGKHFFIPVSLIVLIYLPGNQKLNW